MTENKREKNMVKRSGKVNWHPKANTSPSSIKQSHRNVMCLYQTLKSWQVFEKWKLHGEFQPGENLPRLRFQAQAQHEFSINMIKHSADVLRRCLSV